MSGYSSNYLYVKFHTWQVGDKDSSLDVSMMSEFHRSVDVEQKTKHTFLTQMSDNSTIHKLL